MVSRRRTDSKEVVDGGEKNTTVTVTTEVDNNGGNNTPSFLKQQQHHYSENDLDVEIKRARFRMSESRAEIELDRERWKNRRRMAWISLFAMLVATVALFFWVGIDRLDILDEVIAWFYMAMASVIGTYIGTTTWAHVQTARRPRRGGHGGGYGHNSDEPYDPYSDIGSGRSSNYYDES